MNQKGKLERYNDLVKAVNNCPHIDECSKGIKMTLCRSCNEVNLWTYWEGGRDRLDAEILLVGQDWGQLIDRQETEKALKDANSGIIYNDLFEGIDSVTNINLCRLFEQIKGCEDIESDCLTAGRKCKKVFFTNYACCYREGKTSGGFNAAWTNNCKDYFVELVNIIQPIIIICLGRKTFDSVLVASGNKRSKGSYNDTILAGFVDADFGETTAKVFPVAHPGAMGTLNRCRAKDNISKEKSMEKGLELQISDWKKINDNIK